MKNTTNFYPEVHATTVIGLIKDGKAVIGADGQVSFGNTVMKGNARKVRTLYEGKVMTGFAGATADAFTLLQRFEEKLEAFRGNLQRASIELAKDWRTDRYLRRLEAMLIVMNNTNIFLISGTGDVIEPEEQVIAIGSGGNYAYSSAISLLKHSQLSAREIVEESLKVASKICIYTNDNFVIEELP